ncbi:MAG: hypothetical protein H7Z37_04860 [Pyrinomonadaceae bacterium]|nr:hypothetical protein [Pyrinomonadaceae bacterium]
MSFIEWWKSSSQKAGEDYEKLRFDSNDLNDIRNGFLSESVKDKFKKRYERQTKIVGFILSGCLALILLILSPFVCVMGYSFIYQPQSRFILGVVIIIAVAFCTICYGAIFLKVRKHWQKYKADLNGIKVNCERGNLKIEVKLVRSGSNSNLVKNYSVNNVVFEILEDAIGAEIHRQFLSPIITIADSRETVETYSFYHLPESKMVLHYEQA